MKVKTTLYLDREMKEAIERAARERRCSEAELVRSLLAQGLSHEPRVRRLPRFGIFSGPPDLAERADEYLQGFGED